LLSHALAAIHGEATARTFAPLLLDRGSGWIGARYFRRFPDLAAKVLPPIAEQRSITGDVAKRLLFGQRAPEPDTDAIPPLLADPPWHQIPARTPIDLAMLETRETVVWAEGERERWLEVRKTARPMTD